MLFSQLDGILTSLGRKIPPGRIAKLRAKFDPDNTGRVDWASTQFVMTLASLNVVDVAAIGATHQYQYKVEWSEL